MEGQDTAAESPKPVIAVEGHTITVDHTEGTARVTIVHRTRSGDRIVEKTAILDSHSFVVAT